MEGDVSLTWHAWDGDSEAVIKAPHAPLPQRPRRFYVPCIILLVVFRLEIIHTVARDIQCASRGVEVGLPMRVR